MQYSIRHVRTYHIHSEHAHCMRCPDLVFATYCRVPSLKEREDKGRERLFRIFVHCVALFPCTALTAELGANDIVVPPLRSGFARSRSSRYKGVVRSAADVLGRYAWEIQRRGEKPTKAVVGVGEDTVRGGGDRSRSSIAGSEVPVWSAVA